MGHEQLGKEIKTTRLRGLTMREKTTDLPVLLPAAQQLAALDKRNQVWGYGLMRPTKLHLVIMASSFLVLTGMAHANTKPGEQSIIDILLEWTPFLFEGFLFNILISALSMLLGTFAGAALGLMQISLIPAVKHSSWFVTQFFRNAPWLCLLFFAMFMLPFQFDLGFVVIPFPDWLKAVIGLSLPIMANISEIVRGSIQSIPNGQWEAAESLAFNRRQQLWQIILPQCVKRMIPPWMNWYAILTMATVLASVVGVNEVMARVSQVSAASGGRVDLLAPIYFYIMTWFFIYTYPIARLTVLLERKFAVKS